MPGAAFTRKEYYININKETTAFKTEEAVGNQTAISGEIQETPSFKPSNDPIRTKKHSELGAISNVLKGAFRGTLSYSDTIQDWRPLARLLGNTIDMVRKVKGTTINVTGNIQTGDILTGDDGSDGEILHIAMPYDGLSGGSFAVGDTVTWNVGAQSATIIEVTETGTTGIVTLGGMDGPIADDDIIDNGSSVTADINIASGQIVDFTLVQFQKDEALTFEGSGATGTTLDKIEGVTSTISGTPSVTIVDTDVFVGGTSGARAAVASAADQTKPTIQPFNLTETLSVSTASAATLNIGSQTSLIYQHQLAVVREQNSYVLNYAYKSLDDQHLMTGCVMKQVGLESAVNEAPKFAEDWLLSTRVTDPTRDAEVLNTLALYEYVDMSSLSIDANTQDGTSVDWTDILKAFSATFNRSNLVPVDSHTTQAPTGMKGPEVESTLNFEIHRQNATLWNLNLGSTDDDFAVALTFARGVSGEDDAVLTYSACRAYEIEEAGEETILLTVPVEVKGTPTVVINDTTPDYST